LPSLSEGSPLVTLEAMAAGVPVVASTVGGIPEQIWHDREGLLVPPGDAAALSEAVVSLLRDPARARRLGEAGRRRVSSEFSYATMLRQTERVYSEALRLPVPASLLRGDTYGLGPRSVRAYRSA
jgi:glycosyltransferase involved in cell wall biosynthesis